MSIKTEILTLQHIRSGLAAKIGEMQVFIRECRELKPHCDDIAIAADRNLQDLQALYNEVSHELQTNSDYTRTYPALCAIGMPEDVKTALLGKQSEDNDEKDC